MKTVAVALAVALAVDVVADADADADEPPRPWYERITLHGAVDVYYAWNFNRPQDGANFLPGTGTAAKRANDFNLNLADLDFNLDPNPVGVHLALQYGNGPSVLYGGEPTGPGIGPLVFQFIQAATLSYKAPLGRGLTIEAGILPSHVGFEVLQSWQDWNYTRAWMSEFSPYYQAGIRFSYPFTDHWTVQLYVLNGWQLVGENNEAKTLGTQLAWSSDRLSAAFNTLLGPELPGDNTHWRFFGDWYVVGKPLRWLGLAASFDLGYQQLPGGVPGDWWYSAYGWARVSPWSWLALCIRGGYYDDRSGLITGTPQALAEGTGTLEFRPPGGLIIKLEGRYDHSTAAVFTSHDLRLDGKPLLVPDEGLLVLGAVATF